MAAETARIEAFSDGVFAIAITLLILEIKIPQGNGPLAAALVRQWPSYVAFLLSFAFIGIMWVNHHRLFTHIRRATEGLIFLNLALLLGVTVIPFPTAVLATHLAGPDARTAAMVFNGVFLVIAIVFNVLWRYAVGAGLLDHGAEQAARLITRQYAFGPLLYLICLAVGWWSVSASLVVNVLLAVFFALPPQVAGAARSSSAAR